MIFMSTEMSFVNVTLDFNNAKGYLAFPFDLGIFEHDKSILWNVLMEISS